MPRLQKQFNLEVTPEQFLHACSGIELQELELLIQAPRFREKMNPEGIFDRPHKDRPKPPFEQLRIDVE